MTAIDELSVSCCCPAWPANWHVLPDTGSVPAPKLHQPCQHNTWHQKVATRISGELAASNWSTSHVCMPAAFDCCFYLFVLEQTIANTIASLNTLNCWWLFVCYTYAALFTQVESVIMQATAPRCTSCLCLAALYAASYLIQQLVFEGSTCWEADGVFGSSNSVERSLWGYSGSLRCTPVGGRSVQASSCQACTRCLRGFQEGISAGVRNKSCTSWQQAGRGRERSRKGLWCCFTSSGKRAWEEDPAVEDSSSWGSWEDDRAEASTEQPRGGTAPIDTSASFYWWSTQGMFASVVFLHCSACMTNCFKFAKWKPMLSCMQSIFVS